MTHRTIASIAPVGSGAKRRFGWTYGCLFSAEFAKHIGSGLNIGMGARKLSPSSTTRYMPIREWRHSSDPALAS